MSCTKIRKATMINAARAQVNEDTRIAGLSSSCGFDIITDLEDMFVDRPGTLEDFLENQ